MNCTINWNFLELKVTFKTKSWTGDGADICIDTKPQDL